jgi:hypothetical protein
MKRKFFIAIILIVLVTSFVINSTIFDKKKEMNMLLLPSLPKPIAKEYALITSAGQSTEAYIISDIANKLMIHNYFMPEAKEADLEGINTLVFVVGYSSIGKKLHGISYDDEKKRIRELIEKSKKENLIIITVFIGGKNRRDKKTDELLSIICPDTDYLIATKESNYNSFLSELAKNERIPLTLINEVKDVAEPFVSAFR